MWCWCVFLCGRSVCYRRLVTRRLHSAWSRPPWQSSYSYSSNRQGSSRLQANGQTILICSNNTQIPTWKCRWISRFKHVCFKSCFVWHTRQYFGQMRKLFVYNNCQFYTPACYTLHCSNVLRCVCCDRLLSSIEDFSYLAVIIFLFFRISINFSWNSGTKGVKIASWAWLNACFAMQVAIFKEDFNREHSDHRRTLAEVDSQQCRLTSVTNDWQAAKDQVTNNAIYMAEMKVFCMAGHLIEERRRWPVI